MNKLIKGSIASAAGIALLLGGGATLASWNSSVTAAETGSAATITAGTLDVAAHADQGVWTLKRATTASPTVVNIATVRIVPGDTLTYTKKFNITATGDNLKATLAVAPGSIAPVTPAPSADSNLAALLGNSATFTVNGAVIAPVGLLLPSGASTLTVATSITFPSTGAGAENGAKNGAVNLAGFAVTVSQIG
jgi:alternate signal-mediated exported protein